MIRVVKISGDDWKKWSEQAHAVVFHEKADASEDRIDFTLVVELEESARMLGYITCREHDSKTVYWQYGGAFPGTKDTAMSYYAYKKMVEWCGRHYDRITTVVENTNYPMLKMHLKTGFLIAGFRVFKGKGYAELVKEFQNA